MHLEYDAIVFDQDEKKMCTTNFIFYDERGESCGDTDLGKQYHILIIPQEKQKPENIDKFKAILTDPLEYISRMLDLGYIGVIAKCTTTSDSIIDKWEKTMRKKLCGN